jgi:hypothetical protein
MLGTLIWYRRDNVVLWISHYEAEMAMGSSTYVGVDGKSIGSEICVQLVKGFEVWLA